MMSGCRSLKATALRRTHLISLMRIYNAKSEQDFVNRVRGGDITLARIIVDAIIHNLDSTKRHNYIVTVKLEDEEEYYDLTCHSEEFIVTLEKNLKVLVDAEAYEECSQVVEAIKYLKGKKGNSYVLQN